MEGVVSGEDVQSAAKSFLAAQDCTIERYEVKPFSDGNLGFMGRHLKVTCWVACGDGTSRRIDFFAKLAPASKTQQTARTTSNYFTKEVFTYVHLAPKLQAFLPPGETLPLPRCVLGRDEVRPNEDKRLLILEDVSLKGFRLLEDVRPLDLAHCRAVLKSLAKFHVSSWLLQESLEGEDGKTREEVAKEVFRSDSLNWMSGNKWALTCARSMTTAVALLWPEKFAGKEDRVLDELNRAWERVYAMAYASDKYANVLCHADLWINNILFSYEKDRAGRDVPKDVVFVDLQFVHYTPPALDLLLFLHLCTRRDFRDGNWRALLEFYHAKVEEYVTDHTQKSKFQPFPVLLESYEEFMEYGRFKSTGYLPTVLESLIPRDRLDEQDSDVLAGMLQDRGEQIYRYCKESEAYRARIEESFRECLEGLDLWE